MFKAKILAIVAGGIALALAPTEAQQKSVTPSPGAMALTANDYLDIQQLVTRYAFAVDSTLSDNGQMYAGLFTPDGTFVQGNGQMVTGREGLAAIARKTQKGPMAVRHFLMNHVIEPTPEGAIGREYLAQINIEEDRSKSAVLGGGHYDDVYVKTADGWRFKRRQHVPSQSGQRVSPFSSATFSHPVRVPGTSPVGTKGASLTPSDYVEIQQIVNRYPYGLDTGADHGAMYANVFTLDGLFFSRTRRAQGRDALKAFAWEHRPGQGPLYARNFATNVKIEPSADGATGKVYALVMDIGENGKPTTILGGAHYEDVYVRTTDGWRIKSREVVDFEAGPDLPETPQPPISRQTDPVPLVRPKDSKATTLSAQDYVELQQLTARYSHYLDTNTDDGYAYADLFTPDGAAFNRWIGREQISDIPRNGARQPHGPKYVRHYAMNHLIEPTAGGAIGKQYVVVIDHARNGQQPSIFLGGQYQDVYVKTPKGWRFKTRVEFGSRFVPPTAPSHSSR